MILKSGIRRGLCWTLINNTYKSTCVFTWSDPAHTQTHTDTHSYLEWLLVDQAVDQDEALSVLYVQISHGGELLGPRRVQDLQHGGRRVHLDLLAVEVLDGRVVFLDEGAGDELDGQRGLADAAAAQHDNFVLFHLGRRRQANLAANDLATRLHSIRTHRPGLGRSERATWRTRRGVK